MCVCDTQRYLQVYNICMYRSDSYMKACKVHTHETLYMFITLTHCSLFHSLSALLVLSFCHIVSPEDAMLGGQYLRSVLHQFVIQCLRWPAAPPWANILAVSLLQEFMYISGKNFKDFFLVLTTCLSSSLFVARFPKI